MNPKTIWVHKNIRNVIDSGADSSTARLERRWPEDIEYRLVDPSQQSKVDRIRAEIVEFGLMDALKIIDRISKEAE